MPLAVLAVLLTITAPLAHIVSPPQHVMDMELVILVLVHAFALLVGLFPVVLVVLLTTMGPLVPIVWHL
jgi:hypothetical protein